MIQFTGDLLQKNHINMSDAQFLSLVSHLSAMVNRSVNKEPIAPIDKNLFTEVSTQSIELADRICKRLEDLHEDEKYLLSVHFEAAKMNL